MFSLYAVFEGCRVLLAPLRALLKLGTVPSLKGNTTVMMSCGVGNTTARVSNMTEVHSHTSVLVFGGLYSLVPTLIQCTFVKLLSGEKMAGIRIRCVKPSQWWVGGPICSSGDCGKAATTTTHWGAEGQACTQASLHVVTNCAATTHCRTHTTV